MTTYRMGVRVSHYRMLTDTNTLHATGLLTHLMLHWIYCVYMLQEPSTVEAFALLEGLKLYGFHLQSSMPDQSQRFWLCHCCLEASSDKLNHGEELCRKSSIPKGREASWQCYNATNTLTNTNVICVWSLTIPLDTWRANLSNWLGLRTICGSCGVSGEPPFEKLWWRNWT